MDATDLNKETATPASGAGTGGNQSDSPTDDKGAKTPDTPAGDEEEVGTDGKPLPYDKDPKWKAARHAEKVLQGLMKANEVDDPDELMDLLKNGKAVAGKINVEQLDDIIEKANTLSRYEAYWADQEEAQRRSNEEPDETVARVSKENADLKRQMAAQRNAEANQQALKGYDTIVTTGVKDALPDLPKEQADFLVEFLGVGNPAVEVDITDRAAVAKVVKQGIKKFDKFKQIIIKDYLEGKERIPDVQPHGGDSGSPSGEIKDLRSARRVFLSTVLGGGRR